MLHRPRILDETESKDIKEMAPIDCSQNWVLDPMKTNFKIYLIQWKLILKFIGE